MFVKWSIVVFTVNMHNHSLKRQIEKKMIALKIHKEE